MLNVHSNNNKSEPWTISVETAKHWETAIESYGPEIMTQERAQKKAADVALFYKLDRLMQKVMNFAKISEKEKLNFVGCATYDDAVESILRISQTLNINLEKSLDSKKLSTLNKPDLGLKALENSSKEM